MTNRVRVRRRPTVARVQVVPPDEWQRVGRKHFLTRDAFEEATYWRSTGEALRRWLRSLVGKEARR